MASGDTLKGRRLPDAVLGEDGPGWEAWATAQPGDYMRVARSAERVPYWYTVDPRGRAGTLVTHTVVEHEDGTITVTPSILDPHNYTVEKLREMGVQSIAGPGWHGWLERGVWREA